MNHVHKSSVYGYKNVRSAKILLTGRKIYSKTSVWSTLLEKVFAQKRISEGGVLIRAVVGKN